MKRLLIVLCAILFLIILMEIGFAAEASPECASQDSVINTERINYEASPVNKLGRGAANMLTFWAELPAEIFRVSRERNPFIGSTLGFVQGACTSFLRAMTAVFDTATFVIPPYDKPLMEPEYAIDDAAKQYKEYFDYKR
ncbi:MAG: exosortase system-associated protein, TIGR04073 family [Candidatus Omnitrophica bacterium]|nr:exosortase system-associated protein, TIGR04073 family [Candidatus Omnitrophota bacterium]